MVCTFIPPHLSKRVSGVTPAVVRTDTELRTSRLTALPPSGPIQVWTASRRTVLPGAPAPSDNPSAVRVRSHAASITEVLGEEEFPDAVVGYGKGYANAFFNGSYLVFGEGDGVVFGDFTASLDIMAHEFGHALVSLGPGLLYANESGALNEHLADVFGVSVQQYASEDTHDWRIGEEIILDGFSAVRNMLHPGTAYDNALLGKDPQPAHMSGYRKIRADNGGVHINSGIPNRAFALLCENTGEPSWGRPLAMWRRAMLDLRKNSTFRDLAKATWTHSGGLNPAVREAWGAVGVMV